MLIALLVPLALLPLQDPALAVAELERCVKLGYRGACIPCTAPGARPYSNRAYDSFWLAAQEAGVPFDDESPTDDLSKPLVLSLDVGD